MQRIHATCDFSVRRLPWRGGQHVADPIEEPGLARSGRPRLAHGQGRLRPRI